MLVANILVETLPGKAQVVAEHMKLIKGMGSLAADSDHTVRATWKVPDNDTVEGIAEVLRALNPEILEVNPTLVGQED